LLDSLSQGELEAIAAEPYEPRGILHSEMALIIHTCRRLGVMAVVESGRARGQSTYMLAKYMSHASIHSVELRDHPDEKVARERLAGFANVALVNGDGAKLVPVYAAIASQPTAILLDGPKGAAAVAILEECFQYPHVAVGFIHDMRRLDHGGRSPHRAVAAERLAKHAFSDDPRVTAAASWMDAAILAGGGPCGAAHEAEFGSYGPTLGVFLNHHSYQQ
jgi:hypothetical protein